MAAHNPTRAGEVARESVCTDPAFDRVPVNEAQPAADTPGVHDRNQGLIGWLLARCGDRPVVASIMMALVGACVGAGDVWAYGPKSVSSREVLVHAIISGAVIGLATAALYWVFRRRSRGDRPFLTKCGFAAGLLSPFGAARWCYRTDRSRTLACRYRPGWRR